MPGLRCKEVILRYLADYLDGALDAVVVVEFERHLRSCSACAAYLSTYAKTRELVDRTAQGVLPGELQSLLRRFLVERQ